LGITSQANCGKPYSFFGGMTCGACDTGTGACCTGGNSSITNITGCNALGGIFFPEGTTALCVTGSCCTGGTCTQEIAGRSGNCQLFIAGSTCGICTTGVYCTGATCFQLGFRGQSLTNNFIAGATCSSCILGACCTGGTCIGGGITAQINCPSNVGSFVIGATSCGACNVNVNCCIGGTHSYVLRETCISQGGIVFEGAQDPTVCASGVFCTGGTCAGETLFGFNLSPNFILDGDCGDCILGNCCEADYQHSYGPRNDCSGTFYPGAFDATICVAGLTFGICCEGATCSEDVEKGDCTGVFIENELAAQNSISCGTNACQIGICCGETDVTSVTGGVCLGVMTRAECSVTGGDFFPTSDGYTCSNCLYTPMLASLIYEKMADNVSTNDTSTFFTAAVTGFTGNQIQPRGEIFGDTWVTYRSALYGSGGTVAPVNALSRRNNIGVSQTLRHRYAYYSPFKPWFSGITMTLPDRVQVLSGITGPTFDYSPIFDAGVTNANNTTFGYIIPQNGDTNQLGVPRYLKVNLGYGNPKDGWYGKELVYRYTLVDIESGYGLAYTLNDATKHAQLPLFGSRNDFPTDQPYFEDPSDTVFSSPILVSSYGENPLSRRVRPIGSCCVGVTCIGIITSDHCASKGGTFHEEKFCSRCYPDLIFGNCCVGGTHAGYTSLGNCNAISGVFFEGSTFDANECIPGIVCNKDRTCFQGKSFAYYGDYSSTNQKFFIEQQFGSTLGCLACDAGLCCVGATCMGKIPKVQCYGMGGTVYYNEDTCQTNCDLGICCNTDKSCGVYTNRANCYGPNQVFLDNYGAGQTCAACQSLMVLTEYAAGVTYTYTFNKSTTFGTFFDGSYWVQETPNLKLMNVSMSYRNQAPIIKNVPGSPGSTLYSYSANTKISNIQIHPNGLLGSLYIHGMVKNPKPMFYRKPDGFPVYNKHQFMSIIYESFNNGWSKKLGIGETENPDNYDSFDLNKFLAVSQEMKSGGMTLAKNDTVLCSTTNFDIEKKTFPSNAGGYPYQISTNRANIITYGVINCLSEQQAAFAGSTVCFRPSVCWPEDQIENRPIYPVSLIEGKIPGQTGNTLTNLVDSYADNLLGIKSNVMTKYSHSSEFGGGINYATISPFWSHGGAYNYEQGPYGGQWTSTTYNLLASAWGTSSSPIHNVPISSRRLAIQKIVQFGIDAWGPILMFATLSSGAGQRPARSRPWAMISGYYLGVTSMRNPETTLLSNTNAINNIYTVVTSGGTVDTSGLFQTAGETAISSPEWWVQRFSATGANNSLGIRQLIGIYTSLERLTMIELSGNTGNFVRYWDYLGRDYKYTISKNGVIPFSGITGITFSSTGPRGLSFSNATGYSFGVGIGNDLWIVGNFAKIHFGDVTSTAADCPLGPFSGAWTGFSFFLHKVKVVSGPGSGPTEYKIVDVLGNFLKKQTAATAAGGGWQVYLDRPWQHGIPTIDSTLKFYPFGESDAGVTRPSSVDTSGFTSGAVFYMIGYGPYDSTRDGADSSISPETVYFNTAFYPQLIPYAFIDFVTRTYGVTFEIDSVPTADYIKQYIYTSPYNIAGLMSFNRSSSSVLNYFIGATVTNFADMKTRVNFATHFPGIISYGGITV